ncbi:hypothetical protein SVXHr_2751 [Halorhabdus sp. SVX81]|uniref:hypothetical protein n=1 Tax=Halorhabdus sp. SVX81 TaxID=2978283 RepID=UPI0023DAE9F5|nr:hypothetical protein [Halorhabdus sp. SVX81]WEL18894.1 hypothetical protein SVXHr_2751 [Halorhabdus sp. SVX81]
MRLDWGAIDEFWEGFIRDHDTLIGPTPLQALPDSSEADEWKTVDAFWDGYVEQQLPQLNRLENLLTTVRDRWNNRMGAFNADPLSANWGPNSTYEGPLRTTIDEEDWSQWLAHLLRTSTGPFVAELLGLPNKPPETVRREVEFSDNKSTRRIDILVKYPDTAVSIEVKNGDSNYGKTPETARLIEEKENQTWTHILLLRRVNSPRLRQTFSDDLITDEQTRPTIRSQNDPSVEVRYWQDVSHALRWILTEGDEPDSHWQASAYLFVTLIEQRILDLHSMEFIDSETGSNNTSSSENLHRLVALDPERQIRYLEALLAKDTTHE